MRDEILMAKLAHYLACLLEIYCTDETLFSEVWEDALQAVLSTRGMFLQIQMPLRPYI